MSPLATQHQLPRPRNPRGTSILLPCRSPGAAGKHPHTELASIGSQPPNPSRLIFLSPILSIGFNLGQGVWHGNMEDCRLGYTPAQLPIPWQANLTLGGVPA